MATLLGMSLVFIWVLLTQCAWYYWLALCFSLFLCCILLYVHPLTLPFICLTLGLLFITAFSVYIGFWPKFTYIRGFLAKSRVYMQFFGQNPRIHATFWPKVTYIRSCSLNSRIHPPFWWVWCCGKLLGGLWVWLGLPWVWCCDQRPLFHWFFFESSFSHLSFLFFH